MADERPSPPGARGTPGSSAAPGSPGAPGSAAAPAAPGSPAPAAGTAAVVAGRDRVGIGCVAPQDLAAAAELEALGVDSLWVGGHIASRNPSPEPMAWLAGLAAVTRRVVVGSAVVILPLYPPALIAKQIADLDNRSGGRIALGIGVGGEYPGEFSACQIPLKGRGARTDEAVRLLRWMWTGRPVDHPGPLYPMENVRIHPAPRQPGGPPIIVAGRQEPAMRRAAWLGDGWMPYMYSPRRYRESVTRIRAYAEAAGRDLDRFAWMAYVPVCVDDDGDRALRTVAGFLGGTYRQDFTGLAARVAAAGTAEHVAGRLAEYVEAGARHLVLLPCGDGDGATAGATAGTAARVTNRTMARVMAEVAPLLRAIPPAGG